MYQVGAKGFTMIGTYICAYVSPLSEELLNVLSNISDLPGHEVAPDKLHVTVVYSEADIDKSLTYDLVNLLDTPFNADVIGAACFDALPDENGARNTANATIVLRLKSKMLTYLHQALRSIGASHSYSTYEPHVSVRYGVPRELACEAVDTLNIALSNLTQLHGAPLNVSVYSLHIESLKPIGKPRE